MLRQNCELRKSECDSPRFNYPCTHLFLGGLPPNWLVALPYYIIIEVNYDANIII